MIKPVRWTIARKVGGTVCVLLIIILSLLIHSILSLNDIVVELNEVSTIDVPLTEYANEIEIAQLEQRILLDEIIRKKIGREQHQIEEEQAIEQWGARMDKQFELAIQVSQRGVKTASSSEFQNILTILKTLQKQHEDIDGLLRQVLSESYMPEHLEKVIEQDEQFDLLAIDLIHDIERITQRQADIVLKHEEQFALISYSLGGVGVIIGILLALIIIVSIKVSISKISRNIHMVSSAIESNEDIPIEQVERVKSSDEFSELSHNLANMIERVSSDIDKREKESLELNEKATRDHLTQCYNRLKWDESCKAELEKSLLSKTKLSLILFDIDHFKKVNDSYGHDVGDSTLIDVVRIAQQSIRQVDSLYRTGGEEFSILLPDTNLSDAEHLAERVRKAIAEFDFDKVGQVTISLGVTMFNCSEDDETSFVKRADIALYQAKKAGRNQVSTQA